MAYAGQVYRIGCDKGGLSHSQNIDLIGPDQMVAPSKNINLHEGGRGKRGGTAHVYAAAISGTPRVMGIYDFMLESGTQYIISYTNDGKIYKDDTNTISTGLTAGAFPSFESAEDTLFMANGVDVPKTWVGGAPAGFVDMSLIPSSWTGTTYPKQFIKHGFANSEMMWALGFKDGSCYCSLEGDFDDFSDANVTQFVVTVGDGFGIVGGFEYGDRLFLVSRNQTYIVDDTDVDKTKWGYQVAQWRGGAAHHRLIVNTPNDVVLMDESGEIFSVVAATNYGDYEQASIARPAKIDNWIRSNIDLAYINDFHACYDPNLRAIKFFMVRKGETEVDMALVYFIDRGPEQGWIIHDNQMNPSGYTASCSALVRKSTGIFKVYTGDYAGNLWELETDTRSDNALAFYGGFKTPNLVFDNARVAKLYDHLRVILFSSTGSDISMRWWVDGTNRGSGIISTSLAFTQAKWGTAVFGTDLWAGTQLTDAGIPLGYIGKRIQVELYNETAANDFLISQVMIDFKALGPQE
jgi:hypothetical protein